MSKLAHKERWGGRKYVMYKSGKCRIPGKSFSIILNSSSFITNLCDTKEDVRQDKQGCQDMLDIEKEYHDEEIIHKSRKIKDISEPQKHRHHHSSSENRREPYYPKYELETEEPEHEELEPELDFELETGSEPMCDKKIKKKHQNCIPRKGELIINGGFENYQDAFFGWVINSGVDEIDPRMGDIAHQGINAARLGFENPHATIYQNVPGICPGTYYQLNFYLSAAMGCGSVAVKVRMEFLDQFKNPLSNPVLNILIPEDSLSEVGYTGFCNTTQSPAPPNAHFARVRFEIEHHSCKEKHIHLDDISLVAL